MIRSKASSCGLLSSTATELADDLMIPLAVSRYVKGSGAFSSFSTSLVQVNILVLSGIGTAPWITITTPHCLHTCWLSITASGTLDDIRRYCKQLRDTCIIAEMEESLSLH